ncbi:MAG TPA: hypothetical protein PKI70_08310, partial [Mesotoga sp.]|nr:hypothetical protein [Mesotoga sp.]
VFIIGFHDSKAIDSKENLSLIATAQDSQSEDYEPAVRREHMTLDSRNEFRFSHSPSGIFHI